MKATTDTEGKNVNAEEAQKKEFLEWLTAKEAGSRRDYESISKFRFDKEVKARYKGLSEAYSEVLKKFVKSFKCE